MRSALAAALLVLVPAFARAEEADPEPHPALLAAAQSESADPEALAALSTSRSSKLRIAVASNPRTWPGTLARMAGDASPRVRIAIAGHCGTPQDTRSALQRDKDQLVAGAARRAAKSCAQWKWRPATAQK